MTTRFEAAPSVASCFAAAVLICALSNGLAFAEGLEVDGANSQLFVSVSDGAVIDESAGPGSGLIEGAEGKDNQGFDVGKEPDELLRTDTGQDAPRDQLKNNGNVADKRGNAEATLGSSSGNADSAAVQDILLDGWRQSEAGNQYYEKGQLSTGLVTINGDKYYFDDNGYQVTGWQDVAGERYFFDKSTGAALRFGHEIDGDWYYFNADDCRLIHGSAFLDGSWYWYDLGSGKMLYGSQNIYGGWYRYDLDCGKMLFGSQNIDGDWYRYDLGCGMMLFGSQNIDGDWYRYDLGCGMMLFGSQNIDGDWYWYDLGCGKMQFAWQNIYGDWYFYNIYNGAMCRGWANIDGDMYWFDRYEGKTDASSRLRWFLNKAPNDSALVGYNGSLLDELSYQEIMECVSAYWSHGYDVAFVLLDITSGKGIALNPDKTFYGASTIKGPYIASLFKNVFGYDDYSWNAVYDTMYQAVVHSSNEAYIALRNWYGNGCFVDWVEGAGVSKSVGYRTWSDFTPRELAKMWLQMFSDFGKGNGGAALSSLFSHSDMSAIYSQLGDTYQVRSKPGWNDYATNDAGIVYSDKGPYVLTVMSDVSWNIDLEKNLVSAIHRAYERVV